MSSDNSLVTFKKYSPVYFTPVMMDKQMLLIDWKITSVKIHLSQSWLVV